MIPIEVVQIKPINKYTVEEQKKLGEFGYVTDSKYRVSKIETEAKTVIEIELVELENKLYKTYINSEEDYERYSKLASMGYSLGAYIGSGLVGVVIAEEMQWNNTLLIWHFQVAEDYRRKSIGKQLINELTSLAKANRIRAINLETQNTNVDAISFYRKCGFEIEGVDLSYYTNNDALDGEVAIFMKCKIG
ncbi:GNAT family N-acetyltransferase [Paenibacillus sp. Marseille-Q7038]